MSQRWIDWNAAYDDPRSDLARRLVVVRHCIRDALNAIAADYAAPEVRVISLCAGDGRDLLPVLAERADGAAVRARLVEIDPDLAGRAAESAHRYKLSAVEVVYGDAGTTTAYAGIAPAHLVLACGVFGNITAGAGRRTVAVLRTLTAANGYVVWTRGRARVTDPSVDVRSWFRHEGFTESSFTAPSSAKFRVGMHKLNPARTQPYCSNVPMFAFVDD